MLLSETVRVAVDALRANKLRSLLTMLGIVIGVGAVIAMVALGNGAQAQISERIARLGTTVLQINPQHVHTAGIQSATTVKLTTKDVDMIVARSPNVLAVNWQQDRQLQVVWKNQNANVQVTGTAANFPEVRGFRMAAGRMFGPAEEAGRRKVAVLGANVLPLLNVDDAEAMIGQQIRIAGRAFTVIGVLAQKGTTGFGDGDEQILIPFQTSRFHVIGTDRIDDIWALASSEDSLSSAMAEIQAALRRSHKTRLGDPDDFRIRNQSDLLSTLQRDDCDVHDAAGRHRGGQPARRRHRHHECHARLGDGAHARDRRAQGAGRHARQHPLAVPERVGDAVPGGWRHRGTGKDTSKSRVHESPVPFRRTILSRP